LPHEIVYKNFSEARLGLETEHKTLINRESNAMDTNSNSNTEQIHIPELSTSLDDLKLPVRYLKLVKRLRNINISNNIFRLGETLGDLVKLSTNEVASLPGIGTSYVNVFKELKQLSQTAPTIEIPDGLSFVNQVDLTSVDISDMRLTLAGVDAKFTKALEKYARYIDADDLSEHLDTILNFEQKNLISLKGFGNGIVNRLIEFKWIVKKEIESIATGKINYKEFESKLIVPNILCKIPLKKIERILLEDIDGYLDKISDDEVDIAQRRWGFTEPKHTLEEIALDFGCTRERVRQQQVNIENGLLRNLRISQKLLWKLIEPELNSDICMHLNEIYSCFSSENDFYEFISLACGQERLIEYVYPELDKSILNSYFAENGAPTHIDDIREYLTGLNLDGVRNIDNAIQHLAQQDILFIEGEYVWPRQLRKAEASACVLVNHERGLPWSDIAKLVNGNGYSKTDIYEDHLDNEAFKLPEYIFLAGKGVYKHTRFINIASMSLDELFAGIMAYANSNKRNIFHLNECYQASSHLQKYDYFVVRHLMKNFGEDYGFYFEGRSQSDSVGLEKGFKNITQKDVIVETMNNSERPLTKPEIANLLKSKSLAHASFYLDCLIDEGKIIQIDRMLYTTPISAYKDINICEFVDGIDTVLHKYKKPVEPSIFQKELNALFVKSYSKFFYASIARLYADKKGWFRKHNLYCINEIPFKSLKAALDSICDINVSTNENIEKIQLLIAITRENAAIAFSNWRNTVVN